MYDCKFGLYYVSRQIFRSACHNWCNILQSQGQFKCIPIDNSPVRRCTFWLAERHNRTDIWNRWVANTVKLCALHWHKLRKSLVGWSRPLHDISNDKATLRAVIDFIPSCTIGQDIWDEDGKKLSFTFWKKFKMSFFYALGVFYWSYGWIN